MTKFNQKHVSICAKVHDNGGDLTGKSCGFVLTHLICAKISLTLSCRQQGKREAQHILGEVRSKQTLNRRVQCLWAGPVFGPNYTSNREERRVLCFVFALKDSGKGRFWDSLSARYTSRQKEDTGWRSVCTFTFWGSEHLREKDVTDTVVRRWDGRAGGTSLKTEFSRQARSQRH